MLCNFHLIFALVMANLYIPPTTYNQQIKLNICNIYIFGGFMTLIMISTKLESTDDLQFCRISITSSYTSG